MRRVGLSRWIFLLVFALCAGGCVGVQAPRPVAMSAPERVTHNRRVFERAWQLVNEKFFDAKFRGVDWGTMKTRYLPDAEQATDDLRLYGVINEMLGELKESHNYGMSPQRRWEFITKQRARVGVGLRQIENSWVVTEVVAGSPAAKAKVQPGWLLTARDGKPWGAAENIVVKEGDGIVYDFLDEHDQRRTLTLVPKLLSTADRLEARELANGSVYLRFDGFNLRSLRWLNQQLKIHRAAPAAIIDLRHNHGGTFYFLRLAVGEFFPDPVEVGTFIRRSGSERERDSLQLFSARYPGKVILLTDRATGSCAEILAHALRYHGRAEIVGRPTAGAVVVSLYFRLPHGGSLQLAVEDFRGLDGQRLEGVGVKPDIDVPLKLADLRAGIDADLQAALMRLREPAAVARH